MSLRGHLQVVDVSAQLRGDDADRPVITGHDGTRVVMVLDPDHAAILAGIVARAAASGQDSDIDRVTWDHAAVDLLASKACAGGLPIPVHATSLEVVR